SGSGGQQGVYYSQDGLLEKMADTSSAMPGGSGNFTAFSGALGISAPQTPPAPIFVGFGSGGQQGVYVRPDNGPVTRVADKSTAIPGGSGFFTGFGAVSISSQTALAFIGMGSGGQTGIYAQVTGGQVMKVAALGGTLNGLTINGLQLSPLAVAGN